MTVTPKKLGEVVDEVTLPITRGEDFNIAGIIKQPTEDDPDIYEPVNLTNCSLWCQVRKYPLADEPALATIDLAIALPLTGAFSGWFDSAVTIALPVGTHRWSVWIKDSLGKKRPLWNGNLVVEEGIVDVE